MRKFLVPILMAGVMMPAAALAQDSDRREERREQRAERANSSDDDGQVRPRAERPERPQVERVQRVAREPRVERHEQQVEPNQQIVQTERVQRVAREPRFDRRERRVERDQQVEQDQQIQQIEEVQRVRTDSNQQVQVRRSRGGFLDGVREAAREQQIQESNPATRDGRRDGYRDGRRDGYDRRDGDRRHRWSGQWRSDNRYNWHRYRTHNRSIFRLGRYYDPYGWGYRRFSIGFSIGRGYYGSNYWLDDPWQYRLPPAYGPYRWVRYYDDALLVNIYSGEVVDVIHSFFW